MFKYVYVDPRKMLRSKSPSDLSQTPRPHSTISSTEEHARCSLILPEDHAGVSRTSSDNHSGLLSPTSDADDSVFTTVTDVQIEEFRDVFRIFDVNQDGMITSGELIKILR